MRGASPSRARPQPLAAPSFRSALFAALFAGVLAAPTARAQDALRADPPQARGAGCPPPVAARPLDTPTRFELDTPAFELNAAGPGSGALQCRIAVRITVPAGVSIRLRAGELGGAGVLDARASGRVERSFLLDGRRAGGRTLELPNAFEGSFFVLDDLADEPSTSPWSACSSRSETHMAELDVQLRSNGGAARIAVRFARVFRVDTRSCAP